MSDLIDRQDLGAALDAWLNMDKYYHPYSKGKTIPVSEVVDIIKSAPTIEPVKKGKWIYFAEAGGFKSNFYKCSECGKAYWMIDNKKDSFCRWCGARMGEEE